MIDSTVSSSSLQSVPTICWGASVTDVHSSSMMSVSFFSLHRFLPYASRKMKEDKAVSDCSDWCPCMLFAAFLKLSDRVLFAGAFSSCSSLFLGVSLRGNCPHVCSKYIRLSLLDSWWSLHMHESCLACLPLSRRPRLSQQGPLRASKGRPSAASTVPGAS